MTRLLPLLLLLSFPAYGQVIDGDTIRLDGQSVRLFGIDAPEAWQWCGDYPAGALSTQALVKLIGGNPIQCEKRDTDRYGRAVSVCYANGADLNRQMVRLGMAWAYTRYSADYIMQEQLAKADGLGVHAHPCVVAWDWRAQQRGK